MSTPVETPTTQAPTIHYPESDGQPMAENTLQFQWIVLIKENIDALFADDPQVFVAGDLLWYPVEGQKHISRAPDTMVVFGRPKGYRGSYKQWEEDDIAPQVVFEVRSPANNFKEMADKLLFYDQHGVDEYYVYDPHQPEVTGFLRQDGKLRPIAEMHEWVSPRLRIRFDTSGDELRIFAPDGSPFVSFGTMKQEREQERQRAERLTAKLRELGIDPEES